MFFWSSRISPCLMSFLFLGILGLFLVLSSKGLVGSWVGLELSFFSCLIIISGKSVDENECSIKYFFVQVLGAALFLFGGFSVVWSDLGFMYVACFEKLTVGDFLVWSSLVMKLGLFPGHFWVSSVVSGINWLGCFWVLVVQKLGSFWVVGSVGGVSTFSFLYCLCFLLTSLLGSVLGLGVVKVRSMLAYSSLIHSGWSGLISIFSLELLMIYYFVYGIIVGSLLCYMGLILGTKELKSDELANLSVDGLWVDAATSRVGVCLWLASLSGLPPFLGFPLKVYCGVILGISFKSCLFFLFLSSGLGLYYYMWFFSNFFVSFLSSGPGSCMLWENKGLSSKLLLLSAMMNFSLGVGFSLVYSLF